MKSKFNWKEITEEEHFRLEKTLYNHLRAMKVKKTKTVKPDTLVGVGLYIMPG